MPAYKLDVRGSGRVRRLLKRSQSRKTTFEHARARAHMQTLSISVLHFAVSGQQMQNDTSRPILCSLVSRWMFVLCFVSH